MARRTEALISLLLFLSLSLSLSSSLPNDSAEKSVLLRFKSSVSDPSGALSGWSDSPDLAACSFSGVVCDPFSGRIVSLQVPAGGLAGGLSADLAGLAELRVLNLSSNRFLGSIALSFSNFSSLETLDLSNNQLNGSIPRFFASLPKLQTLDLSFNRLGGLITDEIGENCGNLERLDLSANFLVGGIPPTLGNCSKLRSLLLFSNLLDDVIPPELGGLKNMEVLDVSRNSLSGIVPPELGKCKELSVLVLSNPFNPMPHLDDSIYGGIDDCNYFQGGIPESVTSLRKLRVLWAPRATLEGEIPESWGACDSLEMVNLGQNIFAGEIPRALELCKNLKYLNLSSNKLTGWIHEKLPVPCMDVFDVSWNQLSSVIPKFLSDSCSSSPLLADDLSSEYYSFFRRSSLAGTSVPYFDYGGDDLVYHSFRRNNFTGNLPTLPISTDKYGEESVYALLADGNSITGQLTDVLFGKCNGLKGLVANFSNNLISGVIPAEIGGICKSLLVLDVAGNRISGEIPKSFGALESLVRLDLSNNRLQNETPVSFENLKGLNYLSLARNNLSGSIPAGLDSLPNLKMLDLSSNSFSGKIPSGLANLKNLSALFLDNNKLCGNIPSGFAQVLSLSAFNVSFNNLSGPLPSNASTTRCDSVIGNPLLQGCHVSSLSMPPSDQQADGVNSPIYAESPPDSIPSGTSISSSGFSSIEIASIASAAAIVSVLLALIAIYIYTRKCAPRFAIRPSGRREVTIFTDIGVPITYESVVRATGSFNASNCIGSGGFGATYKAEVSPGVVVAIKRLSVGRFQQGVQQFHAEIKTLGRWRHPNLVTLIGYHVSESEMFLIYNYMSGGNLERFIQERSKRAADWRMLHKIALDVARALAYLHDHCVPRILHRDVKPSNILLDKDFNAFLSDFGLARLLGNSETHATTGVAGTFGYVAPEYAMTCRVSDKADVYSYGVVLLELISDKKALDPSFSSYGNGFNIVAWACMLLGQGRAREFFTEGLWDVGPHDDLVETLHLAVMCTVDSLSIRPTMKQVVQRLKQLQPPTC